ncbi:MAG: hypothetical protein Q8K38_14915 [Burkholderiaceae bacterium]|nr:hypothetical protein [Burkholderiaceae bacterium]MDZ4143675.1 hypothetical protein [Burkholderiales bacterium]
MSFKQVSILSSPNFAFISALMGMYFLVPAILGLFFIDDTYYVKLSLITLVACCFIWVGSKINILDNRFLKNSPRISVSEKYFHWFIWISFLFFVTVTFITAPSIPFVSALQGASLSDLSEERGEFLKGRTGIESLLAYVSTLFTGALVPFSLAKLFLHNKRFRYILLSLFFCYCISFLQKALFLNALLPIAFVLINKEDGINRGKQFLILCGLIFTLYVMTKLASGNHDMEYFGPESMAHYFSAAYIPSNSIDHLLWRGTAVWVFTAVDTLHVIDEQFNGLWLWGATSSFLAAIFQLERIPLEKLVFEYQWSWNDIGNSNSVYITEAYANFGWLGIVTASIFVGQSFRWFSKSQDISFKALWPLYGFALFSSGLIGTLLSNGYVLVFLIGLFVKFRLNK